MRNSEIISVSMPKSMFEWLNNHPEVSASSEFQARIAQIMTMWERQHTDVAIVEKKVMQLTNRLSAMSHFMDSKGVLDEYTKREAEFFKFANGTD